MSAVAALPGNQQCGNPFGKHGGELVVSYFFVSSLLVVLLLGAPNKPY